MSKSAFYVALLTNVGSDWRPPVRPPNNPPPSLTKYDPETTSAAGGFEVMQVLGGLARDVMQDIHSGRTQDIANQVGAMLPMGVSLRLIPDEPPPVGWSVSPSYSLYPPVGDTLTPETGVERITVNGTGPTGVIPGTSIPDFQALPGTSIPNQFTVNVYSGEQVTINTPDYTARILEDRGITVRDFDAQQQREIPADARFDARDHESPRDFDVGRDPGGEDHYRDYQGGFRPGGEIA